MTVIVAGVFPDKGFLVSDGQWTSIPYDPGGDPVVIEPTGRKVISLRDGVAAVAGPGAVCQAMGERLRGRPFGEVEEAWADELARARESIERFRASGRELVPTLVAVHHEGDELRVVVLEDGAESPAPESNVHVIAPPDLPDPVLDRLYPPLFTALRDPALEVKLRAVTRFFREACARTAFAGGPLEVATIRRNGHGWEQEVRERALAVA